MPAGTKVASVEAKLKKEYGSNKHAIYGTLNKAGLMHGNKPTSKGLKKQSKRTLTHIGHSQGAKRTVLA